MKRAKTPLISILSKRYPEITKEALYASVMCGEVRVGEGIVRNPREMVDPESEITLERSRYVSRGGEKLSAALTGWNIDVRGKVVLDAGSSTGGFTDALLQFGAVAIHAVDVGYNQIDYRLRTDPRVILHERTNIMAVIGEGLLPAPQGAVADLSFRSLAGAASHILSLTTEKWCVALGKPQFEMADADPDFHGIVKSGDRVFEIMRDLVFRLQREGVVVKRVMASPILGRKGNREFLLYLVPADNADAAGTDSVIQVLRELTEFSPGEAGAV